MKAMLKLLDGQPTTVQDKPSRLLPSPSPLPQQKEEKEVHAEVSAGTGKAVEEEEEEEEVSIEREPLRPSPQSEFRQVI